jgi:uncharacterized membrane protein
LVRCKVCGYITAEKKLGEKCPACGAPRAVFEPHTDRVSERRRRILNLTIHPIAVHFPQAFAASVLILLLAPLVFRDKIDALCIDTAKILSFFLPLVVAVSLLAGLYDGKTRFKKIQRSPILKRKLVFASLFFLSSLGLALMVWLKGIPSTGLNAVIFLAAFVAFVCSFVLGLLGTQIVNSELPGD